MRKGGKVPDNSDIQKGQIVKERKMMAGQGGKKGPIVRRELLCKKQQLGS